MNSSWCGYQLEATITAITGGRKVGEICRQFNIHEATLRKRLQLKLTSVRKREENQFLPKDLKKKSYATICFIFHNNPVYEVTLTGLRRTANEFPEGNNLKQF
jgi:hypothetical protein